MIRYRIENTKEWEKVLEKYQDDGYYGDCRNEMKVPKEYPCVMIVDTGFMGIEMDPWTWFEFIYKSDFE